MVGGGLLVAGLAGGAVTLVLGFPTVWAIVTAVGAFLLGGSGAATLIQRYGKHQGGANDSGSDGVPSDHMRQLALSEISEEVEAAHGVLDGPRMDRFFVKYELATWKWEKYGPILAATNPVLHKEIRGAYRAMDALNNRGIERGLTTSRGEQTTTVDSTLRQEAEAAINGALTALGAAESA